MLVVLKIKSFVVLETQKQDLLICISELSCCITTFYAETRMNSLSATSCGLDTKDACCYEGHTCLLGCAKTQ